MAERADDILITSGSGQGLDLINEALLEPGDTVIMEQLSYSAAISRVRQLGVKVVGVPLDEQACAWTPSARRWSELKAGGVRPKYIYTIPTIQNPTGSVLPLDRRHELLRLSAAYGVPIFEDECYADLLWEGDGRPPSAGFRAARTSSMSARSRSRWPRRCASATSPPPGR